MMPMSAATGRGEHCVCTTVHWISNGKDSLLKVSSTCSWDWQGGSWNFFSVPTALKHLLGKTILSYWSCTAQGMELRVEGGVATLDEIHRQIDQCTLIPINHKNHRAWIIISCAVRCLRNNFCPQCKGEGRRLQRYIISIIAQPRYLGYSEYLGAVGPPCWHLN